MGLSIDPSRLGKRPPPVSQYLAPLGAEKIGRKNSKKSMDFCPKAPSGAQMLVSGAWGARNQHFKISGSFFFRSGFLFAIFGRASGQIFEKIQKNCRKLPFWSFQRAHSVRPGEAVNKSAASAASLDGFSSRDQVGC